MDEPAHEDKDHGGTKGRAEARNPRADGAQFGNRPAGLALATVGVARTFYANILGKGREMSVAADTPIEVQLAPPR
jgi:hypothetical protein